MGRGGGQGHLCGPDQSFSRVRGVIWAHIGGRERRDHGHWDSVPISGQSKGGRAKKIRPLIGHEELVNESLITKRWLWEGKGRGGGGQMRGILGTRMGSIPFGSD